MKENLFIYDSKIKIYKNGNVELTNYQKKIYCDTQEDRDDTVSTSTSGRVSRDDILNAIDRDEYKRVRVDSLSRSRKLLIDYSCENEHLFNSFITLTFKENVTDLTDANKKFNIWCRQIKRFMKKIGSDFYYLGVPEFQKRGAVHYHLLTNLEVGYAPLSLQKHKNNMYDVLYWKNGYASAFDLSNTDEQFNIALYITKYLYKDFDKRLFGHTRVLKSNNLKKPVEYRLLQENITYKTAYAYLKEKYDITNVFTTQPDQDNPYIIPSISLDFKSHDDNSILKKLLEEK